MTIFKDVIFPILTAIVVPLLVVFITQRSLYLNQNKTLEIKNKNEKEKSQIEELKALFEDINDLMSRLSVRVVIQDNYEVEHYKKNLAELMGIIFKLGARYQTYDKIPEKYDLLRKSIYDHIDSLDNIEQNHTFPSIKFLEEYEEQVNIIRGEMNQNLLSPISNVLAIRIRSYNISEH